MMVCQYHSVRVIVSLVVLFIIGGSGGDRNGAYFINK